MEWSRVGQAEILIIVSAYLLTIPPFAI